MRKFNLFSVMMLFAMASTAQDYKVVEDSEAISDSYIKSLNKLSTANIRECSERLSIDNASVYKAPSSVQATYKAAIMGGNGIFYQGISRGGSFFPTINSMMGAPLTSLYLYPMLQTDAPNREDWSWNWTAEFMTQDGGKREESINDSEDPERGVLNLLGGCGYPVLKGSDNSGNTAVYDISQDKNNRALSGTFGTYAGSYFETVFDGNGIPNKEGAIEYYGLGYVDAGYGYYACYGEIPNYEYAYKGGQVNAQGSPATGAVIVFKENPSSLIFYGIDVVVFNSDLSSKEPAKIPEGVTLTAKVCKLQTNEDGQITGFGDVLAEATCNELNDAEIMAFDFKNEPVPGISVANPVIIPANTSFAIKIEGLDKAPGLLIPFQQRADSGSSYLIHEDGSLAAAHAQSRDDLLIGLHRPYFPVIMPMLTEMEIPVEGGIATGTIEGQTLQFNQVYTGMVWSDNIDDPETPANYTIDAPDWMNVSLIKLTDSQSRGWEYHRAYGIGIESEALPSGEKGRQGFVTITSKGGDVARFEVGQGEWTPSGVESVKVANASVAVAGDNLMLTYGEDYNKATVYNVAGSVVASYALPQGGSFEVPAAELNGVYMVVFEGASREVVKVVK